MLFGQDILAVFVSGAVKIFFSAGQPPRKKGPVYNACMFRRRAEL